MSSRYSKCSRCLGFQVNKLSEQDSRRGVSRRQQFCYRFGAFLVVVPLLLSACGLSGAPAVRLSSPTTASQTACEEYAKSFYGTTRESITSALEATRSKLASQSQGDTAATSLLTAIDDVLVNSVVGTNESFLAANDRVIRLCSDIGVTITVE